MANEKKSGVILGLLAGAAIGSLLGVLFAPEKGSETRKRVRRRAEDLREEALDQYEILSEKAKQGIDAIVSNVRQGCEKYREKAEEIVEDVRAEIKDLK